MSRVEVSIPAASTVNTRVSTAVNNINNIGGEVARLQSSVNNRVLNHGGAGQMLTRVRSNLATIAQDLQRLQNSITQMLSRYEAVERQLMNQLPESTMGRVGAVGAVAIAGGVAGAVGPTPPRPGGDLLPPRTPRDPRGPIQIGPTPPRPGGDLLPPRTPRDPRGPIQIGPTPPRPGGDLLPPRIPRPPRIPPHVPSWRPIDDPRTLIPNVLRGGSVFGGGATPSWLQNISQKVGRAVSGA